MINRSMPLSRSTSSSVVWRKASHAVLCTTVSSGLISSVGSRRQPGSSGWCGSPGGPSCWMKITVPPLMRTSRANRFSRATRPAASWRGVSGPNEPCCMSITMRASVMETSRGGARSRITRAGANQAAVRLFDGVRNPADRASEQEYREGRILRQAEHALDRDRREVEVGLAASEVLARLGDAQGEGKFRCVDDGLLQQLEQGRGAHIPIGVERMAEARQVVAVGQALAQGGLQVGFALQRIEQRRHAPSQTAMARTVDRRKAANDRTVQIGASRGHDAGSERRGVELVVG